MLSKSNNFLTRYLSVSLKKESLIFLELSLSCHLREFGLTLSLTFFPIRALNLHSDLDQMLCDNVY